MTLAKVVEDPQDTEELNQVPKQPQEETLATKPDNGEVYIKSNNGLNSDADYDDEVQDYMKEENKYQDIIDYIESSDLMDIKKSNGENLTCENLRNWEQKFGKIYVSKITDDDVVYIWKPLFRIEYIKLIGTNENDAECNWNNADSRQRAILKKCLLFPEPSVEFITKSRAGILDTLESQVMYQSGFISEEQAISSINVIG